MPNAIRPQVNNAPQHEAHEQGNPPQQQPVQEEENHPVDQQNGEEDILGNLGEEGNDPVDPGDDGGGGERHAVGGENQGGEQHGGEQHGANADQQQNQGNDADEEQPPAEDVPDRRTPEQKKKVQIRRNKLLKKKLVTDRKTAKEEANADSVDFNDIKHTSSLKHNARTDAAADYIGYAGIGSTVAGSLGSTVLKGASSGFGAMSQAVGNGMGSLTGNKDFNLAGKQLNNNAGEFNKKLDSQTGVDVFESMNAAGAALGTLSGGIKMSSNIYRATKNKNKHKRKAAGFRAAAGGLGMASSATSGLVRAGNLGLFGTRSTVEGSGSQKAAGVLGMVSGATGLGANILDYLGNRSEKAGHKSTAKDTQDLIDEKGAAADTNLSDARTTLEGFKGRKVSDLSDEEKDQLKKAREKRHAAKAQKYAMAQASKLHKQRSEESDKGLISMLSGISSLTGSTITGISKLLGNTKGLLGTLGTAFTAIGAIGKTIGGVKDFASKKKEQKKLGVKKREVVKEYLDEKITKIKHQAEQMTLDNGERRQLGANGVTLSDDEAKRIALLRLGVEIPDDEVTISAESMDEAFKKLTEKRANNILKADKGAKDQMLTALGLDTDARFEDVVAALSAD
ncbi:MAG: hypothetical protein K5876_00770 [Ruminiclostridium sp.]|nr:hypothetical protein [Ruminiclostridium sp.]